MCTISLHDLGLCGQFPEFQCSTCDHLREREQEIGPETVISPTLSNPAHPLLNNTPYPITNLETPSMSTPKTDYITIPVSDFMELTDLRTQNMFQEQEIENLKWELDYVDSRFNWNHFLYGISTGMALAAIPMFLILRHHNLLG